MTQNFNFSGRLRVHGGLEEAMTLPKNRISETNAGSRSRVQETKAGLISKIREASEADPDFQES